MSGDPYARLAQKAHKGLRIGGITSQRASAILAANDEDLRALGIEAGTARPYDDGQKWVLSACPYDKDHDDGAVRIQHADGQIVIACQHGRCKGKRISGHPDLFLRTLKAVAKQRHGPNGQPRDDGDGQSPPSSKLDDEEKAPRKSQATLLVDLAEASGADFFHTPDADAYATVTVDGHHETLLLKGKPFRTWLTRRYWSQHKATPCSQAVQDVLGVLTGKALFEGEEHPVSTRLAADGDSLYLDLGDATWRVVKITATGWEIIAASEAPVRFRRPKTMLPLPDPKRAGTLASLFTIINVPDPADQKRILGWLVGAFQQHGGRVILELNGEQGAAKSTTARMLRRIVDPNTADLRSVPRDERDLVIAAANGLVVGVDNLSGMPDWLSDALCRLSTGGGIGGRELYSDADEVVLNAQRPVILTGINPVNSRGDRLDRTMAVTLPRIPKGERKDERELWDAFNAAHPYLLGALLDAVSIALANRDTTVLTNKPRMADFALWVEAAAPALGWEQGAFVEAFEAGQRAGDHLAIETAPIGLAIMTLMANTPEWSGTASELLDALRPLVADETAKDRGWPKQANRLTNQINRIAPNLRALGVDVESSREARTGRRILTLTYDEKRDADDRHHRHGSSQQGDDPRRSPPYQGVSSNEEGDDGMTIDRHGSSPHCHERAHETGDGDGGDDHMRLCSEHDADRVTLALPGTDGAYAGEEVEW